ncbi:MAG: GTPase HflX [Clostridia bacterium]
MEEKIKALLVGVKVDGRLYFEQSMEELANLAEACNMEIVGKITQNLEQINRAIYIGTGKIDEVKHAVTMYEADVVIFNNELSSTQFRNLEKDLDSPILDRTALILQIFADRAKTREAKLQVEVARLQYMMPRLVGLHESLGRQGGSAGSANKGSGETRLELDKRRIEAKLTELNKELELLTNERETQRKKRKNSQLPSVALVGYTNAGKSTLLNALVEKYKNDETKKVFEKDMLFATLETSVRNINLDDNKSFLLSDTVGFVSELPHNLVKAFRSTLEEIKQADLLLHVIDFSDPNHEQHIEVTNDTLKDLGAEDIPVIYVYNKADLKLLVLPQIEDNRIYMSAGKREGIDELISMISKEIFSDYIKCRMLIPYDKGNITSYLNEVATITGTDYLEEGTLISLELKEADYKKYIEYIVE